MIILGIDPSLTATGIIVLQYGQVETAVTTKNRPELDPVDRVRLIFEQINKIIQHPSITPDLIVIEGLSFHSKGQGLDKTFYLGWRIREELKRFKESENIPWIEVPPTQLKQFATGKGNANKEIILQQVYKRWGVEFSDNNQADAYVLARIGEAYLNWKAANYILTEYQLGVIANLKGLKREKPPAKKTRKKVKE